MIFMINTCVLLSIIGFIGYYGLRMRKPYPRLIMTYFSEPFVRFLTYIVLYIVCIYNAILGLFLGIAIILLHFDYINIVSKIK